VPLIFDDGELVGIQGLPPTEDMVLTAVNPMNSKNPVVVLPNLKVKKLKKG